MWTYTGQNYEINDFPSLRNILKGKRTTNYDITIYQIRKVNTGVCKQKLANLVFGCGTDAKVVYKNSQSCVLATVKLEMIKHSRARNVLAGT